MAKMIFTAQPCLKCGGTIPAGSRVKSAFRRVTHQSHHECVAVRELSTATVERPSARPTTARRFTCPICGDHRDTTLSGHCDDCEA